MEIRHEEQPYSSNLVEWFVVVCVRFYRWNICIKLAMSPIAPVNNPQNRTGWLTACFCNHFSLDSIRPLQGYDLPQEWQHNGGSIWSLKNRTFGGKIKWPLIGVLHFWQAMIVLAPHILHQLSLYSGFVRASSLTTWPLMQIWAKSNLSLIGINILQISFWISEWSIATCFTDPLWWFCLC